MNPPAHRPRSPRSELALQLIYDDGMAFHAGVAVDMSESGAFIETEHPLAPGVAVRITPLFPERTGPFELRAEVLHQAQADTSSAGGMAIRFLDVDSVSLALLRAPLAPVMAGG